MSVSPDGRYILYTQLDQLGSDLMLNDPRHPGRQRSLIVSLLNEKILARS